MAHKNNAVAMLVRMAVEDLQRDFMLFPFVAVWPEKIHLVMVKQSGEYDCVKLYKKVSYITIDVHSIFCPNSELCFKV